MAYVVGISLAISVSLFATFVGLDRDRAFYPVVTIVVASYYCLFAVMGGSAHALGLEIASFAVFALAAVTGFKTSLWLVATALAGHGLFDFIHPLFIANPGVPAWWPIFCGSYDVVAGAYMGWLLSRSSLLRQQAHSQPVKP